MRSEARRRSAARCWSSCARQHCATLRMSYVRLHAVLSFREAADWESLWPSVETRLNWTDRRSDGSPALTVRKRGASRYGRAVEPSQCEWVGLGEGASARVSASTSSPRVTDSLSRARDADEERTAHASRGLGVDSAPTAPQRSLRWQLCSRRLAGAELPRATIARRARTTRDPLSFAPQRLSRRAESVDHAAARPCPRVVAVALRPPIVARRELARRARAVCAAATDRARDRRTDRRAAGSILAAQVHDGSGPCRAVGAGTCCQFAARCDVCRGRRGIGARPCSRAVVGVERRLAPRRSAGHRAARLFRRSGRRADVQRRIAARDLRGGPCRSRVDAGSGRSRRRSVGARSDPLGLL